MIPRLKTAYEKEIVTKLMTKLSVKNKHEVPKIEKIILNMGLGEDGKEKKQDFISIIQANLLNGSPQEKSFPLKDVIRK